MNKLVLAGMLLVFTGSSLVHAQMPEDCPCRHANTKQKNKVSQQKPIISHQKNNAQAASQPVAQPVPAVKPSVAEQFPSVTDAPSQSDVVPMSEVAHSNDKAKQDASPFYLGVSVGAHHGQISNTSVKSNNYFSGRVFGGYKLSNNLSVELGYFKVSPESLTNASANHGVYNTTKNASTLKSGRSGIDLVGVYKSTEMLPGFYAKAGVAYDLMETKSTSSTTVKNISARDRTIYGHVLNNGNKATQASVKRSSHIDMDAVIGVGYETHLTDNVLINVDYTRYQPLEKNDVKKPINFFSIGTKYQF